MNENNDILICVSLLERALALTNENTREPIKRIVLEEMNRMLHTIVSKLTLYTKESFIILPCMELIELFKVMLESPNFVETDSESKNIITDRLNSALDSLYLFAGKFYMTNKFSYSFGMGDIIKRIINSCISSGFYFGYDNILRNEGVID